MKIYNLKMYVFLAIVVTVSVFANAALIVWSDGFETVNSDWTMNSMWRDTTTAYDGSYSLYNGGSNGHHAIRSIGDVSSGVFEVSYAVYVRGDIGSTNEEHVSHGITGGFDTGGDAWDDFQVFIETYIDDNNQAYMRAWDGSAASTGIEVAKETWNTITLVVRPDAITGGTFDWHLNGVLQGSGYDFKNNATAASTGFAIWHWGTDNTLETFTDSVSVQAPEPATLVLMSIGFLTMANRRKISHK